MTMLTGPEIDGTWTSIEQETAFLSELASNAKVAITELAPSPAGRAIRLVQVGHTGNPSLFVASPHGDEPSGREGILQWVRDLATSTDPEVVAYLDKFTVYAIPTCNPDGIVRNARGSGNWVDINRDHLVLSQPETRNIAHVKQMYHPQIALDLHDDVNQHDYTLTTAGSGHPIAAQSILDISHELNMHIQSELVNLGHSVATYPSLAFPQMAGSVTAFRHSISFLTEVSHLPPAERAEVQVQCMESARKFHATRQPEIRAAIAESKLSKRAEGASPVPVDVGDFKRTIVTPPTEYRLTRAQIAQIRPHIDLFGIRVEYDEGGGTIRCAQTAYPVLPLLLEQSSPNRVITDAPAPEVGAINPTGFLLRVDGVNVTPTRVAIQTEHGLSTVMEPS